MLSEAEGAQYRAHRETGRDRPLELYRDEQGMEKLDNPKILVSLHYAQWSLQYWQTGLNPIRTPQMCRSAAERYPDTSDRMVPRTL